MRTHVVGLGGVGFWLGAALVRATPPGSMVCWDNDNLTGGLGHRRLPLATPETQKTDLFRGFLLVTMGDELPVLNNKRFTGVEMDAGDIVIDCTDMPLARRRIVWNRARAAGAKMIRVSYDGRDSVVVVSSGLPMVGRKEGGYAEVPSLALSLAAGGIGAEIVRHWMTKPEKYIECQVSLKEYALNPEVVLPQ